MYIGLHSVGLYLVLTVIIKKNVCSRADCLDILLFLDSFSFDSKHVSMFTISSLHDDKCVFL